MTLGQRIKAARESTGLSQVDFSKLAKIKQTTLSRWERDQGEGPRIPDGLRICKACGCDLLWLATGLGDPPAFEVAA